MIGGAVLGTMVLLLAPGPGAAQTRAKSPQPSKPLTEYSAAMEALAQSASPAVVQIVVRTLALLEKLDRAHEPRQMEDLANSATIVRQLGILAATVDEKVTAILPDLRRLSGVAVVAVPAEFAGLNPGLVAGDVIYSLNNQRIASLDDLQAALKDKKPGDPIALLVERSGQLIYVTAALE